MGTHASCTSGGCHSDMISMFSVGYDDNLIVQMLRSMGSDEPFRITFAVGVNQIELGWHGSQDYRFLPELRRIEHAFRDIRGSVHTAMFRGEARLNPAAGLSRTGFQAVDEFQSGFFPAVQWLELYLRFDLEVDADAPPEQRRITLFNREPITYRTEDPLAGFPPLNGPDFVQQGRVDLFDLAAPEAGPLGRLLAGSRIVPSNRRLFDTIMRLVRHDPDGSFEVEADLALLDEARPVETAVAWMPTRGIELDTPSQQQVLVEPGQPSTVRVAGRVVDPTELHLEISIRAYSMDPEVSGMVTADVPFASRYQDAEYLMEIAEPDQPGDSREVPVVESGGSIQLSVEPVLGEAITHPEFVWVAPHGATLEDVAGTTATLLAPVVEEHTDIWATVYIRQDDLVSRPHKLSIHVLPPG